MQLPPSPYHLDMPSSTQIRSDGFTKVAYWSLIASANPFTRPHLSSILLTSEAYPVYDIFWQSSSNLLRDIATPNEGRGRYLLTALLLPKQRKLPNSRLVMSPRTPKNLSNSPFVVMRRSRCWTCDWSNTLSQINDRQEKSTWTSHMASCDSESDPQMQFHRLDESPSRVSCKCIASFASWFPPVLTRAHPWRLLGQKRGHLCSSWRLHFRSCNGGYGLQRSIYCASCLYITGYLRTFFFDFGKFFDLFRGSLCCFDVCKTERSNLDLFGQLSFDWNVCDFSTTHCEVDNTEDGTRNLCDFPICSIYAKTLTVRCKRAGAGVNAVSNDDALIWSADHFWQKGRYRVEGSRDRIADLYRE